MFFSPASGEGTQTGKEPGRGEETGIDLKEAGRGKDEKKRHPEGASTHPHDLLLPPAPRHTTIKHLRRDDGGEKQQKGRKKSAQTGGKRKRAVVTCD